MQTQTRASKSRPVALATLLVLGTGPALSQVPVDDDGQVIGDYEAALTTDTKVGDDGIPLRSENELQILVGPIALYPDDLLAIVLPATTYPLQVVQAARFLEDLEDNPGIKPDDEWDDSIVALVNYPEVVELLNEDLDWTWKLGEAVVAQQGDVLDAIANFREQAYAAGNLKSDEYQTVTRKEEVIEIEPVSEEVIYVPYYEPERVVVYQPRPVYYYYPRAYPVYYYPYPTSYAFSTGYFWGVTTAFSIGWATNNLSVFHSSYYGHPYYGYRYWNNWWYRRPSVTVYNNYYVNNNYYNNRYDSSHRYTHGDSWRPQGYARLRYSDQRITRSRYYPNPATASQASTRAQVSQQGSRFATSTRSQRTQSRQRTSDSVEDMRNAIGANQRIRQAADTGRTATRTAPANTARRQGGSNSVSDMREALAADQRIQGTRHRSPVQQRPNAVTPRSTIPEARTNIVRPRESVERQPRTISRSTPQVRSQAPATAYRAPSAPPRSESRPAPAPQRAAPQPSSPQRSAPARRESSSAGSQRQSRSTDRGSREVRTQRR